VSRPLRTPSTETPAPTRRDGAVMHNEFTAIIERDGEWFVTYFLGLAWANSQGRTRELVSTCHIL
jgi:hypothetical protein